MKRADAGSERPDLVKVRPVDDTSTQPAVLAGRAEGQADLDRRLDLALEETFPASDPVSVICN